jgi:hypothetical protein
MLNEHDLNDWKPEDFTQPVGELNTYEIFTLTTYPSTKFRFISKNCFGDSVVQTVHDNVSDIRNYVLPSGLEVIRWSK